MNLNILHEDNDILVCEKPVGIDSQDSRGFTIALTDQLKTYLAHKNPSGSNPYLGVIHRLDRPVGGVMVYAKNKQSAALLSRQTSNHEMDKRYYAVLYGTPTESEGTLINYLVHDKKTNTSSVQDASIPNAKLAELTYQIHSTIPYHTISLSLADIHLKTGRHHQIRVQFAHAGYPLYMDTRYLPPMREDILAFLSNANPKDGIGLYAYQLSFRHPSSKKRMQFTLTPRHGIFSTFQL